MTRVCWVDWEARDSWDQGVIRELTAGDEFSHGFGLSKGEGGVVVLAAQHLLDEVDQIARFVRALPWALVVVCSDEEALYPVETLPRDDRHTVWGSYHARPEFDRVIPIGHAPGTIEGLAKIGECPRTYSVAFAGQATHSRRVELIDVIRDMASDVRRYGNLGWAATTGFREGLTQKNYLDMLAHAQIAPCPSGPHSLDSFRLYEALAAGALPIIEVRTPHGPEPGFWVQMFGPDCPIPCVANWTHQLPVLVDKFAIGDEWTARRDGVARWFQGYREDLAIDFERTIARLRKG